MRCAEESESGSPRISSSALIPVRSAKLSTSRWRISPSGRRDDALRLERVRDLAELPIELDEPRREVVEAAVRLLAIVLEHERVDLLLQQPDVAGKREDVLDRPVVEVEAEPHEPALGGRDERPLAARRVLEEVLALDDGAQRGALSLQVRVRDALLDRADAPDDGRVRLAEAEHRRRPKLRASEERQPRAPRSVAFASARVRRLGRPSPPSDDDAVEPARRAYPERRVGRGRRGRAAGRAGARSP